MLFGIERKEVRLWQKLLWKTLANTTGIGTSETAFIEYAEQRTRKGGIYMRATMTETNGVGAIGFTQKAYKK